MKYRHLLSYPNFHLNEASRLNIPNKKFRNISVKPVIIAIVSMGIIYYEIKDISKHFILPALSL